MKFNKFFERYSFVPALLMLITNLASSFLTRLVTAGGNTYDFSLHFDSVIPFVPQFIYIYVGAFLQWAVCLIAVMIIDREKSFYYGTCFAVANLLSGIVFLIFPTVMTIRPEFSGGGALTEFIGKFIFDADTPPMNIMPSVHVLSSWGCIRMICALKRVPLSVKFVNAIFSALVFFSVLFVKQHLILDIPAGILVFEAGLLITKITRINRKISNLELRILSEKQQSIPEHEPALKH